MHTDLELVETDELVEELLRRFDSAVFAGVRSSVDQETQTRWGGLELECLGLCRWASHAILKAVDMETGADD